VRQPGAVLKGRAESGVDLRVNNHSCAIAGKYTPFTLTSVYEWRFLRIEDDIINALNGRVDQYRCVVESIINTAMRP
jgi:hypothetical protein